MNFEQDIDRSLPILQAGGLILYPTDTIWGIGCDATNPDAVARVYQLKQREAAKSLIVLMADKRDIVKYTSQPDLRIFDFLATVKKPTTVIYEGALGFAPNLVNQDGTIAIRIVNDDFCRHLIKRFRKPIVSTSANISGDAPPAFFRDIDARIKSGVDYVVEYRRDDETPREPSAIVRWEPGGSPTIIRP
ncbi:MAG TPA: L-threonylcarbamoyladenylate synthase [Puia sp.]|uniref:L-threonylcarbamoyladenylate synthase n=1 Tax=Puia sp. TaxID=2045100 RepID=UPI002B8EAFEF|nr:L-threonylcarbamoyladenylate synthase [Puia sp.]HVU97944.1 L-threonylcarbamoyladenylate synthase [Puia sp.]